MKSGLVMSLESFAAVSHGNKPGIASPLVLGNISKLAAFNPTLTASVVITEQWRQRGL